jgi:predicted nucleic acid-binding protein
VKVLVDTSIWSLALRRRGNATAPEVPELHKLINQGLVVLIGHVRQEVLSGIKHEAQFTRLRDTLRAFPDLPLTAEDYEQAAELCNKCVSRGIQASHIDLLLAAAAISKGFAVFTTDQDFANIAQVAQVPIHKPG